MKKNKFNLNKKDIADSMDYRGFHLDFYVDDYGQQFYTKFNNEIISFGSYNSCYKEDSKCIIDKYLDEIPTNSWDLKSPYFGAKLTWCKDKEENKWNIKLTYRTDEIYTWKYAIPQFKIKGEIPPRLKRQEINRLTSASEIFLYPFVKYKKG